MFSLKDIQIAAKAKSSYWRADPNQGENVNFLQHGKGSPNLTLTGEPSHQYPQWCAATSHASIFDKFFVLQARVCKSNFGPFFRPK